MPSMSFSFNTCVLQSFKMSAIEFIKDIWLMFAKHLDFATTEETASKSKTSVVLVSIIPLIILSWFPSLYEPS